MECTRIPKGEFLIYGGLNTNRVGYHTKKFNTETGHFGFNPSHRPVALELGSGVGITSFWDISHIMTVPFNRNNTIMTHIELADDVEGNAPVSISLGCGYTERHFGDYPSLWLLLTVTAAEEISSKWYETFVNLPISKTWDSITIVFTPKYARAQIRNEGYEKDPLVEYRIVSETFTAQLLGCGLSFWLKYSNLSDSEIVIEAHGLANLEHPEQHIYALSIGHTWHVNQPAGRRAIHKKANDLRREAKQKRIEAKLKIRDAQFNKKEAQREKRKTQRMEREAERIRKAAELGEPKNK